MTLVTDVHLFHRLFLYIHIAFFFLRNLLEKVSQVSQVSRLILPWILKGLNMRHIIANRQKV